MNDLLSPKQVAKAIGVSESSLKRWCDQGLLAMVKTAGGHRRISMNEVLRFVREQNRTVVSPEVLRLPSVSPNSERSLDRGRDLLVDAILQGDEPRSRGVVFDLYLAKHSIRLICDRVIATAFHRIGEKWECHEAAVYQERRGCEITRRILTELRQSTEISETTWTAIGGTPSGDSYELANSMVELVLRSIGWNATSMGTSIPIDSFCEAIRSQKPKLFWLSVSHIPDASNFISDFLKLVEVAGEHRCSIVVGGRALTDEIRKQLPYAGFCDTLEHLENFARALRGF